MGGLLPADERILQHVLGVRDAPDHAISDGEEQGAMLVKRGQRARNHRIRVVAGHDGAVHVYKTGESVVS